eukprot:TRINITY_DN984_c0_g1_i3.p3 TRINITY_DN984_c0_g1~~TRINITY_DN984_c0_g1_i3.p3  ORF type:complete len:224 (+),score=-13.62 TRINITY_DN984_c0_g1_i3:1005-1676(+)
MQARLQNLVSLKKRTTGSHLRPHISFCILLRNPLRYFWLACFRMFVAGYQKNRIIALEFRESHRFLPTDFLHYSLFRVVFFPSQYQFAIGFSLIFSLGRKVPPFRAVIPDNSTRRGYPASPISEYGAKTLYGSLSQGLLRFSDWKSILSQSTIRDSESSDFHLELLPVHSQILRQSQLISFPPLSDMLKFSGCSCLSQALSIFVSCASTEIWQEPANSVKRPT